MNTVSIITINYNNKTGLEKTIASVISQTENNFEFIIIDGGSTDGSVDVIKANESKITYWVSEKDKGIYNAQNKGILKAHGDYCLFLNSGDILADTAVLKNITPHLKESCIVYGDLITIDKAGNKENLKSPEKADVPFFMVSTLWHPCAFIMRNIFTKYGLYNEEFKITGDFEFFIRVILKHSVSIKYIPLSISVFDLSGISNAESTNEKQNSERKKSWQLNFSDAEIIAFEEYTRLLRSREYKIGLAIKKIFKPFSKK